MNSALDNPAISAPLFWDIRPISYHLTAAAMRICRENSWGSACSAEKTVLGSSIVIVVMDTPWFPAISFEQFSLPVGLHPGYVLLITCLERSGCEPVLIFDLSSVRFAHLTQSKGRRGILLHRGGAMYKGLALAEYFSSLLCVSSSPGQRGQRKFDAFSGHGPQGS